MKTLWYKDTGGPPGRGYEDNLLEIRFEAGLLIFKKVRFDPEATQDPPFRVDEYTLSLTEAELDVARRTAPLAFARDYDEEKESHIGGGTTIMVTLEAADSEKQKTFYDRVPSALRSLDELVTKLMQRSAKEGHHRRVPRSEW